jgi:hypothetical protein
MIEKEHSLPSKHVLKDKFNRVIKTFEDFRVGHRKQPDGTILKLQGGKTVGVEQPRSKFEKPESEKHSPMDSSNKGRPATLKL